MPWITLLAPLLCGYCRDPLAAGVVAYQLATNPRFVRCVPCARRITTSEPVAENTHYSTQRGQPREQS